MRQDRLCRHSVAKELYDGSARSLCNMQEYYSAGQDNRLRCWNGIWHGVTAILQNDDKHLQEVGYGLSMAKSIRRRRDGLDYSIGSLSVSRVFIRRV